MRRLIPLLALFLLACSVLTPSGQTNPPVLTPTIPPVLPSVTASPEPSSTPTPLPTLTPSPLPSSTPDENDLVAFDVRFHPDGGLYSGDRVSLEIISPPGQDLADRQVQVTVPTVSGDETLSAGFGLFGIAGRWQSTIWWGWDTRGLQAGEYTVSFNLLPDGPQWTETVTLAPFEEMPVIEQEARWESLQTVCCTLYYIAGSDAARDIEDLAGLADLQAQNAVERFGIIFTENITITLMERVLGHGGFAGNQIYVTYSDENYIGSRFDMVLHHEMIHILDMKSTGDYRPSLFAEGLAVYQTGGHFKPEPLMPRAAALLDLETDATPWFVPLDVLADDFYSAQHEIGYLEGAALIEYMVDRWGWDSFNNFYRTLQSPSDGLPSTAIDRGLQAHFGITFTQLEQDFIEALRAVPVTQDHRDDMEMTVRFYDTVRRYQWLLDPSAHFATAWLPDGEQMRGLGIVSDLVRHPHDPINTQIEALLIQGAQSLDAGDYDTLRQIILQVNALLDPFE